jgi:hypothetical protein
MHLAALTHFDSHLLAPLAPSSDDGEGCLWSCAGRPSADETAERASLSFTTHAKSRETRLIPTNFCYTSPHPCYRLSWFEEHGTNG